MSDETRHSPEPWTHEIAADFAGGPVGWVRGCAGLYLGETEFVDDARRIVACVNACAGIPTEALETGALNAALRPFAGILVTLRMAGDPIIGGKPVPEAVARSIIGSFWEGEEALRLLGRLP